MKDFHVRRGAHWIVMSLFLTLAGCGGDSGTGTGDNGNGNGNGNDDGNGTGTGPVATLTVTVGQGGNRFTPEDILVSAGATVLWTWAASTSHNVTFPPIGPIDVASATKSSGTYEVTMPSATGVYDYVCTVHGPSMSGTVTVQ